MKVTTKFGRAMIKGSGLALGLLAVGGIYEGVHRLITDDNDDRYENEDTEEEDEESE